MIRAVLDANVVLSAMISPKGPPARIVGEVRSKIDLVWSPEIVAECHRAADYPKLRTRFRVRNPHRFIDDLAAAAIMVETDLPKVGAVAEDPSDDVYLATALAGAAPWVVSGDRHLLRLERFAGVRIATLAAFILELAALPTGR